jgi:hypothetical protein
MPTQRHRQQLKWFRSSEVTRTVARGEHHDRGRSTPQWSQELGIWREQRDDPNLDGACVIDAMVHLVEDDPSLAVVARLDLGQRADRELTGGVWQTFPYEMED